MRISMFAAVLAIAPAEWAAADPPTQPAPEIGLAACRSVKESAARLKCYDAVPLGSDLRASTAKQSIERLSAILDLYKLDVGNYPSTQQGLRVLVAKPSGVTGWNGPYLKGEGVPIDPWNHPIIYRSPSARRGHEFDLCSAGASGQGGDPGVEGSICNP